MKRTDQPTPPDSPAHQATPASIPHHWIMTVQTGDGRQGTNDGNVAITPGIDTEETTYSSVLRAMRQWIGHENITVLYYRLAPNAVPAAVATP